MNETTSEKILKWFIVYFVVILAVFIVFSVNKTHAYFIEEDFDGVSTGVLSSAGITVFSDGSEANLYDITNSISNSSPNSIVTDVVTSNAELLDSDNTDSFIVNSEEGFIDFYTYVVASAVNEGTVATIWNTGIAITDEGARCPFGSTCAWSGSGDFLVAGDLTDQWVYTKLEWRYLGGFYQVRVTVNATVSDWYTTIYTLGESSNTLRVQAIQLDSGESTYFDDFRIYTDEDIPTEETYYYTQILSLNSPFKSEVTGSTTVDFQYDYYNGVPEMLVGSQACISVTNLSKLTSPVNICEDVIGSGEQSFATSTTLISGDFYSWSGYLVNENGETVDSEGGTLQTFSVVSSPVSDYSYWLDQGTTSTSTLADATFECDADSGFFQNSLCNIAVVLFVPSQSSTDRLLLAYTEMTEKIPFVYVYDFVRMIEEIPVDATSTPAFSVELMEGVEVEFLSASSTNEFYPDPIRNAFRGIAQIAIYVLGGFALWNMRTSIFT